MANKTTDDLLLALQALKPEIHTMLCEDLPEDCAQAEQAYSRQEWTVMQFHVHRINGSASFCKLAVLRAICAEIEAGLKQDRPPTAAMVQDFARQISQVVAALKGLE
jgi:HPt (histidine-containing phosphotransfer) domain-containing protein